MKAIIISVDYGDILAITLPRNARLFSEILVVSSPADEETAKVVAGVSNARLYKTDAFYRHGCPFNKGAAMEEGFDVLGRDGWIAIIDADVLFPRDFTWDCVSLLPDCLHTPKRCILENLGEYSDAIDWTDWKVHQDLEHAGYCQVFNASDPVLARRPWYPTNWVHAGGSDSEFNQLWKRRSKIWLPFSVLHLGPIDTNWCGRVAPKVDGTIPEQAEERLAQLNHYFRGRMDWRDRSKRYDHEKLSPE